MRYAWMVFVLHVCFRWLVGWLVGDFMEIHVFELLWCCEHVFDWWEVIPTVSLAMGYKLASHCNSLIYQKKISTYLCMCLLCELPKNKWVCECVSVGPFEFLLKCLNLQKQGHSVYSDVCLLLMCGLSFSFLLKLMALRLVYLMHQHVFSVSLMLCFYCICSYA